MKMYFLFDDEKSKFLEEARSNLQENYYDNETNQADMMKLLEKENQDFNKLKNSENTSRLKDDDNCQTESDNLIYFKRDLQNEIRISGENETEKVNGLKDKDMELNIIKLIINEIKLKN